MERDEYWSDNVQYTPRVNLVLKGGGIRGLFFPGAILGLAKKGAGRIGALSGASAGALIAVSIWSGLTPTSLLEALKADASKFNGIFGLVPVLFSKSDILMIFRKLLSIPFVFVINIFLFFIYKLRNMIFSGHYEKYIELNIYCDGDKFRSFINSYILKGLEKRGFNRNFIEEYSGVSLEEFEPTFFDIQQILSDVRAISAIKGFDDEKYNLLRQGYFEKGLREQFSAIEPSIVFDEDDWGSVRNNILSLLHDTNVWDAYFPPLFVSVACIDCASGLIISNTDPRFLKLKICDVVRASAGHPLLFKPQKLHIDDVDKNYTDGGVFSNFPTTAAHNAFKRISDERKATSHLVALDDALVHMISEYDAIATSSALTVGLGTEDEFVFRTNTSKIRKMSQGYAKEKIELELSNTVGGFSYLLNRTPRFPHSLNFFATDSKYINKVNLISQENIVSDDSIRVGSRFFCEDNSKREAILLILEDICDLIVQDFSLKANSGEEFVRVHLFFENGIRQRKLEKKAVFSVGRKLNGFLDIEVSIQKENSGILGVCRSLCSPVFCKIDDLQEIRKQDPERHFLGLKYEQVSNVPAELNFCFAMPVFELERIRYDRGHTISSPVEGYCDVMSWFSTGVSGPISALISIDGFASEFEDPFEENEDRILAKRTVETLERCCLELSVILNEEARGMVPSREFDHHSS